MASAVPVFQQNMITAEENSKEAEAQRKKKAERQSKLETSVENFKGVATKAISSVTASAETLQALAEGLSSAANDTSIKTGKATSASEQASTFVKKVAKTAEELNTSSQEIGQKVKQSSSQAKNAMGSSEKISRQVDLLEKTVSNIDKVLKLIHSIADSTNLLSINATIQAVGAGEAGKSFRVIANEVKGLAQQTAKATDDISSQIFEIQESTKETVTGISN